MELGIRPQQATFPTSQRSRNVLDQTQVIYQDVRRNAMQAYIRCKAYYDKRANASTLEEADYIEVLQPKADYQGIKFLFMEFRWTGPYITEWASPNNKFLVSKNATNRTQVLHRMGMRQFTPRQPLPDERIAPREWKSDPEVILKHDDLYARAWECEYEKPIFEAEKDNVTPRNSLGFAVESDSPTEETWITRRTAQECSR